VHFDAESRVRSERIRPPVVRFKLPDTGSNSIFGLVGAGGLGREVMEWVREGLKDKLPESCEIFLVESDPSSSMRNETPILSVQEFSALQGEKTFAVAVADSNFRELISVVLERTGIFATPLIAASASVSEYSTVGKGPVICRNAIVSPDTEIGNFFVANNNSYIAHDVRVGNYVTIGPGAVCCGNVDIQDHAFIGAGALLRPGTPHEKLTIGRGAVVGIGAVVVSDVEDFSVVAGNPAKPLK